MGLYDFGDLFRWGNKRTGVIKVPGAIEKIGPYAFKVETNVTFNISIFSLKLWIDLIFLGTILWCLL